jgi:YD repeat-containing protein
MNIIGKMRIVFTVTIIAAWMLLVVNASGAGVTYSYDSLNRLTNVDYGNGSVISYTYDAVGNRLSYSGAVANDTTAPNIAITSPTTSSSYTNTSAAINLSGTASDNTGVTLVTWQNYSGGIGVASGTNSWSVTGIPLKAGANYIFVTAYDAAGNSTYATLTVTLSTGIGSAPLNQITGYSLANGIYRFTLNGTVGSNYVIYASSDLKYWTPLSTNTIPPAGLMVFVDPGAGGYAKRFYRAVPLGTAVTMEPPPPTPQLTGISMTAGGMFEFYLNGPVGSNYVVQVSSNLVNWVNQSTNAIPISGVSVFDFPIQKTQPQKFYRALPAP